MRLKSLLLDGIRQNANHAFRAELVKRVFRGLGRVLLDFDCNVNESAALIVRKPGFPELRRLSRLFRVFARIGIYGDVLYVFSVHVDASQCLFIPEFHLRRT